MISITVKNKGAVDANGNDSNVDVKFDCKDMREVLYEYALLTAAVRNMVAEDVASITEAEVNATVFSAFKTGMEKIAYSPKAAAKLGKTGRG